MADKDDYWFFQSGLAPTPLAGPQGEAWWLVWGHTKDAWREGTREATKASLPLLCAPDSLGAYADERNNDEYPTETEAQYRQRMVETFDRYAFLGTPSGVESAVAATLGVTDVVYREAWQWDPGSPLWARFWLVCATTYGKPIDWDDPGHTFDDAGLLFDMTGVSLDTLQFLKRQVRRWKAAHAKLVTLALLIEGGHVFDEPDLLWDGAGLVFDSGYVASMES